MPLGTRTDWFARQIRDSNPAPGHRIRGYGTLWSVGYGGCSWASSINDSNAHYLDFSYDEITPQSSFGRSTARQVRCLLE